MTSSDSAQEIPQEIREAVPTWDDEYLDRVSDRLLHNYDLERDYPVRGETFSMYGELRMVARKRFIHPALNYADHQRREHVFVRRNDAPSVRDLESLAEFGNDLAEEWVTPDEEHSGTTFTFVVVAESISDDVRSFVDGFRDRTLLKYGYHGHYEVTLIVVAPSNDEIVASTAADLGDAFALWRDLSQESGGLLSEILHSFRR
jgi:hypothetical protein